MASQAAKLAALFIPSASYSAMSSFSAEEAAEEEPTAWMPSLRAAQSAKIGMESS